MSDITFTFTTDIVTAHKVLDLLSTGVRVIRKAAKNLEKYPEIHKNLLREAEYLDKIVKVLHDGLLKRELF